MKLDLKFCFETTKAVVALIMLASIRTGLDDYANWSKNSNTDSVCNAASIIRFEIK